MPTEKQVNFSQLLIKQKNQITIAPAETPLERRHRLEREAADAKSERTNERIVLVAVLLGVGVVLILCLMIATSSNSTPEDKKWSTAILASIVAFGMSYIAGRRHASK